MRLSRRKLVIGGVLGGGALIVGYWFAHERDRLGDRTLFSTHPGDVGLNGWVKLAGDGRVVVAVPRAEMGQGVHTALAQLVAEEMDARWSDVRVETPPESNVYRNVEILLDGLPFSPEQTGMMVDGARWAVGKVMGVLGVAATGGSTSVRDAWHPMRLAGASARELLLRAAARKSGLPQSELKTADGEVRGRGGRVVARFGELVDALGDLTPLADVPLKRPANFTIIGTPASRLDLDDKVTGRAVFGIDVRPPGLLFAAVRNCPTFGGSLQQATPPAGGLPPGIRKIVPLPTAVAVVGDNWWRAQQFLKAGLDIAWDEGPNAALSSDALWRAYETLAATSDRKESRVSGDAALLARPGRRIEAVYRAPYLAHATMEPMNCTARLDDAGLTLWMPSQSSSLMRYVAAREADLPQDKVTVHTTFLGGGFGRRAEVDLVKQAVAVAKAMRGTPVQVLWSREEDMAHDFYRPMALARLSAVLPPDGASAAQDAIAWDAVLVGQSAGSQYTSRLLGIAEPGDPDPNSIENLPYGLGFHRLSTIVPRGPVPVGFWRSVGHSHTAFFDECFVDEIAHALGKDPLAMRRDLLRDKPRHRKVLDAAARGASWGTGLPAGSGRGIALRVSFGSIVAQVAEVMVESGAIRVKRVVCAIDCGPVVNPDIVRAQMESGIVYGLTAALHGEITISKGRVEQHQFDDYPVLRIDGMPAIETVIVHSDDAPLGGVGEPGTPPIAPAVANAVFAATGQRLRSLPLKLA
ncbi:xanthine dehydrogenase family protein molybdopterin-binding subunit [Vineibacter terrae]|uniref:xanthine dehydrogenase family protein molybdopterin-binding subunit n=1 Tax=Vineibacter terrae TaxID=2586908 RepID=UPI002E3263E2|nr:xanthine dehydrogenase family protein molybdopterin-binding subunit [Vineibacter terrae]HEX2891944.1 xanthine dehydrogenase family protein molybdopterin-binding subunit [Vineibacter terrae]